MLESLLKSAKAAKAEVANLSRAGKDAALIAMADALIAREAEILNANRADLDAAAGTISEVMLDRLRLTPERIGSFFGPGRKVLVDVKGLFSRAEYEGRGYLYWRL